MSSRNPSKYFRGFTLVEMLVVLALIAIMIVTAFPVLSQLRRVGQTAKCVSNLRQIGAAISVYAGENNGIMLPYTTDTGAFYPGSVGRNWYQLLWLGAPPNENGVLPNLNPKKDPKILTVYNCPGNPDRIAGWDSPNYCYNTALGKLDAPQGGIADTSVRVRLSSFDQPSKTIALADSGIRNEKEQPPNIVHYATAYVGGFQWKLSINFDVHRGRSNFLMVDGHVESLDRDETDKRATDLTLLWGRQNKTGDAGKW